LCKTGVSVEIRQVKRAKPTINEPSGRQKLGTIEPQARAGQVSLHHHVREQPRM
jgi:hypothetical protein